jgi:hypothetical protein
MLTGLSTENIETIMAEINSMDKMDVASWENLGEVLQGEGISLSTDALNKLAEAGKNAYNSIIKINFDTFANDINTVYKTLEKVKEGGRSYTEESYKELISSNKSLQS